MDTNNKYGTLNAQMALLGLLKDFHSFCIHNGVNYSLAYGSLLGAVRHDGFIPWDDDLDVFVDRTNYEKLRHLLENSDYLTVERDSKDSLWVDRVRSKQSYSSSGRYQPTLDLLVLDNVPVNPFKRKLKLLMILCLQGMIKPRPSLKKGSFILKICSVVTFIVGKLFPLKLKKDWYRRVSQIGNSNQSTLVANYNGEFSDVKRCYASDMMDHIIKHVFEDTEACIVADYDICLTAQFGDYMTPPGEVDRRPRHGGGDSH